MMNTSILWSWQEAEIVTGGKSTLPWRASGIAISMQELRPGDLYIATHDDDLAAVFAAGAAAAIVTALPENCIWPLLKVGNTFDALQALAAHARYRTHATVIAVQGKTSRCAISDLLARAGKAHEGGRHLSLGLASLPEDAEFGLFGSSPLVRADIAVITNCTAAGRDRIFETMAAGGTILINADDENFLSAVARAKAAGLRHIYTYGYNACADAKFQDVIYADNGARLNARILGEEFSALLPTGYEFSTDMLAAMLVLKLSDKNLRHAFSSFESRHAVYGTDSGIKLIDPAMHKRGAEAVFRVTNMIDLGFGRQTAVLDNIASSGRSGLSFARRDLAVPRKFAALDFVYTGRNISAVSSGQSLIQEKHKSASIESIVPDVLMPGDFLVFKNVCMNSKAIISETLRLIPWSLKRKVRVDYAI